MKKESGYKTTLKEIFDGSVLTKGFLQRNAGMLLILVVCILVYIGNHYSVIMSLNQIDKLKTQLYDVKYEALTRSSELMHESRQSRIRLRVQEQGLGLEDALTPPYKIDIKE